MITAAPRLPAASTHTPDAALPDTLRVRRARSGDAAALVALSEPFVGSGALRRRPFDVYAARAADFLVAEEPGGTLHGCLALRVHPDAEPGVEPGTAAEGAGVLYNFCVARQRQGGGLGARLLGAALAGARAQQLAALFTATTGSGRLFLRHGFAPVPPGLAPRAWARTLDPRRGARVLARAL
ncbi:GNAT family N-acetyltransferase [Streptomyces sp. ITFR-6]|uniref:GNAT family N-acetyltransferase n=1 Tax=Streptomyces sp. ITFR-6 TaxID=3075197 RepID=UPI002889707A|nr:GNAT family N-acetyltransferase [Streptomyces sp. ITFR-6]WNI28186.1 GNAT family N-acetyltransferase [Streptomyces sp. ITFR-6]